MMLPTDARSWLSGALRLPISRHLPQGLYLGRDVRRFFPDLEIRQIFDVGANKGQTAIQYSMTFPTARIDSFEPVNQTYKDLVKRVSRNDRIHCHHVALGSSSGTSKMAITAGRSESFRIDSSGTETVETVTADEFAAAHHIDRVNIFKVDTEGYDLEVLHGAEKMIREQRVDIIEVEAGMNPENTLHVYFAEFVQYLQDLEYRIFGFYEQMHEWPSGSPNLRRANIAFVSRKLVDGQH